LTVEPDGTVNGVFSNGLNLPLARVAMAVFNNPGGLERAGNNLFRESVNSGVANIGTAQTGGRGSISSGYLEMSNADIGAEFTSLIVTQRGFQANTRIVSTVDEMMQDVLQMKR
ncbi:MAG: flagellar hook-basal body complex protein, partial [Armatimonadetes bacterium]|nr:flagellar hook-basal body complex protein [Armatimonadota bacterium]